MPADKGKTHIAIEAAALICNRLDITPVVSRGGASLRVDKFRLDCLLQVVCLNWVSKLVAGRSGLSRGRSDGNLVRQFGLSLSTFLVSVNQSIYFCFY